ncbi:hypothetical protein K7X08_007684 [Anisodus acutangulus]|uniref:5-methyltetrahydropteroyltriglutamate--homocysteine S-methyltransferase n=1 Tax=Anisodus acutangulus TaxID=402998 RepID=A0A9Q1LD40_9SOLA|nr:hypothetical protein K7X08_007684 [Anisodus acutangulus]
MTKRPMKGMLTGPVTILNWSFVRNDHPRFETCYQIALAIKDEVEDLEKADINVIQIDICIERGLPLRKAEHAFYLNRAVHSFENHQCRRQDTTDPHSCVTPTSTTLSTPSSTWMPIIPSTEEIADRVNKMLAVLDTNILWVNPDCGLKARKYTEVKRHSNMVSQPRPSAPSLARQETILTQFFFLLKRRKTLAYLPIYKEVISELKAAGASWIQFDEPTLVLDLEAHQLEAFTKAYAGLESTLSGLDVLVESYFADVPTGAFKTLTALKGVTAFGFDLVRGTQTLDLIKGSFPSGKYLFAGVVDGRNIWANDLAASLNLLQSLEDLVGKDKLVVSTSCSLLHTAVDLINEPKLDDEIKSWLAFAAQKVVEVNALAKALSGAKDESAALQGSDHRRATNVSARLDAQQKKLNLPVLPTTTIGSFPQTVELRRVRREYKAKKISEEEYVKSIKEEIKKVVDLQEELDIDVLVHGEPERNDMVEYFGEQLSGFAFTANGWVQSSAGASRIGFDEPTLVLDLEAHQLEAFTKAYLGWNQLYLALMFSLSLTLPMFHRCIQNPHRFEAELSPSVLTWFVELGLDLIKGSFPSGKYLFAGVVDGRNIWANDLAASLNLLQSLEDLVGKDKLVVSTSCSLLHTAVDLINEPKLDDEIKSWLAFAAQKVVEVNALAKALSGAKDEAFFSANAAAQASRKSSPRVTNETVQKASAALQGSDHRRATNVSARLDAQQKKLNLPVLPTTTIGSFPQTVELRRVRREYKAKKISEEEYVKSIKEEIKKVVDLQEELDIDVLVHAERERNDMVEYFGEQLSGFAFTANGWVQSFETRYQIALAIKDEVEDLEKADINAIQIDVCIERGLPLRKAEHAFYLNWAVHSFRITNVGVQDTTQIHTHMCYSNFNDIIHSIIDMDADVITIENSRSDEKLLSVFREGVKYGAGIGPGVYDIHSPRIPSTEEIADRVNKMLAVLDTNILWVNPDCGLKTRKYTEVKPALQNMVSAAKAIRTQLASAKEVISELKAAGASWIQFDEPTLVLDLEAHQLEAFTKAYAGLESTLSGLDVLVESYFADVPTGAFKTLTALKGVTAFGFDLVRGTQTLDLIKGSFPSGKYLFAGVVDGRNIWANDLVASLNLLQSLEDLVGKGTQPMSPRCTADFVGTLLQRIIF